jgi:type III secretion protein R
MTGAVTHPGWYILATLALALVPIILGTTTSYLKISLALGVLRNGFGAQQVPNNAIIMVLSLVLSLYIMQPTLDQVIERSRTVPTPSVVQMPSIEALLKYGEVLMPWRDFLKRHTGEKELAVLADLTERVSAPSSETAKPGTSERDSVRVLLPAFVLTELKEGLMIGFVLLLPFLVIDLVVANILAGLGMYMMSPTMISLPLKLLLFVSVDGWLLISRGFIASYTVGP